MRYTERLKYNWTYHRGIAREVWDIFTLHNYHWLIVGLLVVLCVVPFLVGVFTPAVGYYVNTPVPLFDPSIPQDIAYEREATAYYSMVPEPPSLWAVVSYHWVVSSGFEPLTNVLCVISSGLLLVAYFKEEQEMKWFKLFYLPLALLCMVRIKLVKMRRRNSLT